MWKSVDLRLPQKAANPGRSCAWSPVLRAPVSRLVREIAVTDGTVARTGSRPSSRRPASSQPPRLVSSPASSTPAAAVMPSSTTMTGNRCSATGRAMRSSRFSTSNRSSDAEDASVHAASLRAKSASRLARRSPDVFPQGRVSQGEFRHPAGVGAGDRGEGAVRPSPGAEHPGRCFGQRRRESLRGGEPARQAHGVGGRADLGVVVALAAVRANRDECLLGRGERDDGCRGLAQPWTAR